MTLSYPQDGRCVSALDVAKVQASENFTATTDVSGLSKAQSEIKIKLLEPTRPFNNSSCVICLDDNDRDISSGIYIVTLKTNSKIESQKVLFLK